MKGYGPTGVSYYYSDDDLENDINNGIILIHKDGVQDYIKISKEHASFLTVFKIIKNSLAAKGYTEEYAFSKKGDSKPRLYLK